MPRRIRLSALLAVLSVTALALGAVRDGDKDKKDDKPKKDDIPSKVDDRKSPPRDKREEVGVYQVPEGKLPSVLAARQTPRDPWRRLKAGDKVSTADTLVCLPGCAAELRPGSGVRLLLRGHVKELTPPESGFAVMDNLLESAVVLHKAPAGLDLDVTLLRGRVYLSNHKAKGSASVRLRFAKEVWDVTLAGPGAEVAIDQLTQYTRDIKWQEGEEPERQLVLCLLQGKASVLQDFNKTEMEAPTALLWDNQTGMVQGPFRLPKAPPIWDREPPAKLLDKLGRDLKEWSEKVTGKSIASSLARLAADDKAPRYQRVLALYALGALDDVPPLLARLGDEGRERAPERDTAVFVLRRWLSQGSGQGRRLYDPRTKKGFLIDSKYKPRDAELIVSLLHDFNDEDRRKRETYEVLIELLRHDRIAVRELAYWHLSRVAGPTRPDGEYDPAAPPADRDAVAAKWKKLLDDGKLPPKAR